MFKNFIKTAFRSLKRKKTYTLFNVLGLGIGVGCSIVIYNILNYELSFDRHLSNFDKIYRVYREGTNSRGEFKDAGVPFTTSYALRNDYPGIKAGMFSLQESGLFILNMDNGSRKKIKLDQNALVEPQILDMLDVKFIYGSRQDLNQKNALVLNESHAKKLFDVQDGNYSDIIGHTVTYENKIELIVYGVFEDLPENSEFNFKSLVNYDVMADLFPYFDKTQWGTVDSNNYCYVLIDPEQEENIELQFESITDKYYSDQTDSYISYKLQPLNDIHFNEDFYNASKNIIDKQSLLILIVIVLVLILTACINFVNLSTALVVVRAKEIGIRKAIGSSKRLLVFQFVTETLLIAFLSAFLGLGVAELLNVNLAELLGKVAEFNILNSPELLVFIIVAMLVIVILAGLYPALVLSRINPINALKTSMTFGSSKGLKIRRLLVVFQFVITQVLIFGTLVLHFQMDYFYNKNLGFESESIVNVRLPNSNPKSSNRFQLLLDQKPEIVATSLNLSSPMGNSNTTVTTKYEPLGIDEEIEVNFKLADENYIDLFGLNLLAGRNIRKDDKGKNILINQKLMKYMGFENPEDVLGEKITSESTKYSGTVIGVLEDFHVYSLKDKIPFTALMNYPERARNMTIKIKSNSDTKGVLDYVESSWNRIYEDNVYHFKFYDDFLDSRYKKEENITALIKVFAVITILIGCLGLYGLIAFVANQKTKEIGIRKVLGATLANILNIFSKEIVYLTLVAFLIAAPIGYYFLDSFLDNFYYRISIGPIFYLLSLALTLLISTVTVGYRSYITSIQNPVISLKDE